ncbi:MAG: class I SAM-dependent methyltransferase [Alphaproteobacteria bacterium]|nr:class I SAM-dependent methyltransferase [Alphaproteobacteria bacterium]
MTDEGGIKEHFHDQRAKRYDETVRKVIPGYETLHAMAQFLLEGILKPDAHLLIVGCGTGEEIERLASHHPGWRFTGIDPSQAMLDQARERLESKNLLKRCELLCTKAESLDPALRFDAATCLLVMHFLPDDGAKAGLLSAIASHLKPEAPLLLADLHGASDTDRFARLLAAWTRWQLAHGVDPVEVEKGLKHVARDVHFVPETRLFKLLHQAGFGSVEHFHQAFLFGGWLALKDKPG